MSPTRPPNEDRCDDPFVINIPTDFQLIFEMGASLILWILLGGTTAVVAAQLIGELVVSAIFVDLVNPYYAKIGGSPALL
jgi:hypothetical protein